ncbi:MAG: lipid IV(A) 3-deoxy-D-manno-octulosonic acid transferase [Spongiibacteraceae bacterium]
MYRFIYSLFFYSILPLIYLRLLWRSLRAPEYRRRMAERFGVFEAPAGPANGLWLHAVSVGESIAAAPLIRQFQARYPELPIVITTTTPTGSERVREIFGDTVFHVYAPYDTPRAVSRFLDRLRPSIAVFMETEVWPNMVCLSADRGIPVVLANARMSEKSARGYGRLGSFSKDIFSRFAMVAAQSEADAARFAQLGVRQDGLAVVGSVKFDVEVSPSMQRQAEHLRQYWLGGRSVWIAASTHAGEEEQLLAAHRSLLGAHPDVILLLVPRHPERFGKVADLIEAKNFTLQRRSEGGEIAADTQVVLGDSMGELSVLLGCSDLAFVGGSLVAHGGHNTLEAAVWGQPIITGASDFNFVEISRLLKAGGALKIFNNADELAAGLVQLFASAPEREAMAVAAKQVIEENRGALARQFTLIANQARLPPR